MATDTQWNRKAVLEGQSSPQSNVIHSFIHSCIEVRVMLILTNTERTSFGEDLGENADAGASLCRHADTVGLSWQQGSNLHTGCCCIVHIHTTGCVATRSVASFLWSNRAIHHCQTQPSSVYIKDDIRLYKNNNNNDDDYNNKTKLWCKSTTNPVPVLRIAASRGFSVLTKNVIRSSHGHSTPSLKISCKSIQPFSRNLANKETNK